MQEIARLEAENARLDAIIEENLRTSAAYRAGKLPPDGPPETRKR